MNLRKLFISISNKHDLYYRIVLVSVSILVVSYFLPRQVRFKYNYKPGHPWAYEDVRAPFTFPVDKSTEELDSERASLLAEAPAFFRRDTSVVSAVEREFLSRTPADDKEKIKAGLAVIKHVYQRGILEMISGSAANNQMQMLVVRGAEAEPSMRSRHLIRSQLPVFIRQELTAMNYRDDGSLEKNLAGLFRPDLFFDELLTNENNRQILTGISPVRGEVLAGTILIRRGQYVGPRQYEELESLRRIYQGDDRFRSSIPWLYAGYLLLVLVSFSVLLTFLWLLRRDILVDSRRLSLLFLLIVGVCVGYSLLLGSNRINMLMVPLCILPLVTRAFFDTRTALFAHVLSMLVLGTVAPAGFDFVFMQIIAGMVAIFSIVNMRKRSQLFLAVSFIIMALILANTGLSLINEGDISRINLVQGTWLLVNGLLTLLAYPLIFFIEKVFRVTSDFTLMELTDFNNELLRELALKTPGTFQHSLQVANLAESAIYRIGGNSLLVRVGALYHDIGKTEMPLYFIENQSTQVNPHDELSFDESASIIISHVIRGVEKAKKFKLPDVIIDFIRTHHGTMMVQYFYNSFLKNFPDQVPNEDDFRYRGPKPFSKETAVLMMADSVEAASRSLAVHDQDTIDHLVDNIINHQIESGQFENCDITFKDISTIKRIFKKMLASIYHIRVAYPG